METPW